MEIRKIIQKIMGVGILFDTKIKVVERHEESSGVDINRIMNLIKEQEMKVMELLANTRRTKGIV